MSQSFLLRKALTDTEAPLLIAAGASYYFRRIHVCNNTNNTHQLWLAVTAGRAFADAGDWVYYEKSISSHDTLTIDHLLVPDGHEMRGYASAALQLSLVGSGVMEQA
jgi:hypothetical protein